MSIKNIIVAVLVSGIYVQSMSAMISNDEVFFKTLERYCASVSGGNEPGQSAIELVKAGIESNNKNVQMAALKLYKVLEQRGYVREELFQQLLCFHGPLFEIEFPKIYLEMVREDKAFDRAYQVARRALFAVKNAGDMPIQEHDDKFRYYRAMSIAQSMTNVPDLNDIPNSIDDGFNWYNFYCYHNACNYAIEIMSEFFLRGLNLVQGIEIAQELALIEPYIAICIYIPVIKAGVEGAVEACSQLLDSNNALAFAMGRYVELEDVYSFLRLAFQEKGCHDPFESVVHDPAY